MFRWKGRLMWWEVYSLKRAHAGLGFDPPSDLVLVRVWLSLTNIYWMFSMFPAMGECFTYVIMFNPHDNLCRYVSLFHFRFEENEARRSKLVAWKGLMIFLKLAFLLMCLLLLLLLLNLATCWWLLSHYIHVTGEDIWCPCKMICPAYFTELLWERRVLKSIKSFLQM